MANIDEYIKQIQQAQYGEEVRGSIVNALKKVNDDNNSYVAIKKEVVAAKDIVEEKANAAKETLTALQASTQIANEAKSSLNNIISSAISTKKELEQAVLETGEVIARVDNAKSNLDKSITSAGKAELNLQRQIETSNQIKNQLDVSNNTAIELKKNLDVAINEANTAKVKLVEAINNAGNAALEKIETAQSVATRAVETAKVEAVKAITTAGTTETKKVTDEGAKQVQTVQSIGTQETEKVTAEGTKQVGLVKTEGEKQVQAVQIAAQEIITDREQINTNKEGVAQLKEDLSELSEEVGQLKQNGTGTGTGLSTEAIDKLEEVGNYLVYTTADGGSKWTELIAILRSGSSGGGSGEIVPATGISLDKTTLSFTTATTQTLIATVDPSNSTDRVTWESSNTGIATVSGGVVTPVSNGSCTITAKSGSCSASCEVTVAVESEIVTYTITNNLTNVSTDNPATTVNENSGYIANLTADTDYTIDSVTVTMGGVDVTSDVYTNGAIVISVVTGNVVITAIAVQSGSTEEITLLKSITGDGNSYIDTEVLAEVGHRYEFSMKLVEPTQYFFGADMYNVGTPYKNMLLSHGSNTSINGIINGVQLTNVGTWNGTESNLLDNKQFYFVMKNGSQAVYLDAEYTKQQTNVTNGAISFGDSATMPIIPLYLFKVNFNNMTNGGNASKYVPSIITVYWLKIYEDSTDTLLHEFVPAKQGSKVGMYDTVTQKFHENIGNGTFSYEEVSA